MIDSENYINEQFAPDDFEFVQQDAKIYDKKFETKPIGYFKDAMIRFCKNKTNVVATIILFILVLLSILVPILTTKNYTVLKYEQANLPPRVPYLEKIGIMDGTRKYTNQTVDINTIDPKTGLGLPVGFNPKYILMDTLKNTKKECSAKAKECVGGENVISLNRKNAAAIISSVLDESNSTTEKKVYKNKVFSFRKVNNPIIKININEIKGKNAAVNLILSSDYRINPANPTYHLVETITETTEINVYEKMEQYLPVYLETYFTSPIILELVNDVDNASVALESVEFRDNKETIVDTGYDLSLYQLVSDKDYSGRYTRQKGILTEASFRFDEYGKALGEKEIFAFSQDEYKKLVEKYPICVPEDDPDNPDPHGKIFPKGCPIRKINGIVGDAQGPDGTVYYSYNITVDYALYQGYEGMPYFLFGTDAAGRDYFTLVWLGLRTSLIVGLIVSSINITIGIIYGAIEGYYGGTLDLLMERFGEIIGRIPFLVWLALFVVLFGPGILTLILLLTVTGWLGVASVTRTQFYRYKGREYVLASRTLGAKDLRIIFRHILPNGIGTLITASILMIPGVIFAESTISYLGYGIGSGQSFKLFGFIQLSGSSIGILLYNGRAELLNKPYLIAFPAIIISILMITFNMFGNALRDAFNPSLRGSE